MSVKVSSWAWDQPLGGNDKVVLLALADWARDDGLCWPGQDAVAAKARVSTKTVQRLLGKLEEGGYLVREKRGDPDGGRKPDLIRLMVSGQNVSNGNRTSDGGVSGHPRADGNEPSVEPSESLAARPPAEKPTTYRGKKVPPLIVDGAVRLLEVFNEAAGRSLSPRTADGSASPVLKQIVGAMLARPDVAPDAWEAAVRNTAANPPRWCADGPLQIGHVFGERAAEWALSNQGRVASSRDAAKQGRVDEFMDALKSFTGGE